MKAEELILNGYYTHNSEWNYAGHNGVFQWSELDWYKLGECGIDLKNIEPIQLTEEWLVKFGFRFNSEDDSFRTMSFAISVSDEGCIFFWVLFDRLLELREFKHVHQLQNIYYALTGEELTINI